MQENGLNHFLHLASAIFGKYPEVLRGNKSSFVRGLKMTDTKVEKKIKNGKKRQQGDRDEESDNDSSSDAISNTSDESFDESMEIPVEFEAFPPTEQDFHGIKCLLQQLFLKSTVDLSSLSDLIISQPEVTTVIKVVSEDENENSVEDGKKNDDEDEREIDIFGVTTVVNLRKHKENTFVKQLSGLLVDKCKDFGDKETFTQFTDLIEQAQHAVGFLINERFINIPPQIAVPVYKTLRAELKEIHKKEKEMALSYFVIVCKTYKEVEVKKKKKAKKPKQEPPETTQLNFINVEDKVFLQESELSFTYPASANSDETLVGGRWTSEDSELQPYRTVLLLSADKFGKALERIHTMLTQ